VHRFLGNLHSKAAEGVKRDGFRARPGERPSLRSIGSPRSRSIVLTSDAIKAFLRDLTFAYVASDFRQNGVTMLLCTSISIVVPASVGRDAPLSICW
jgi:hypothetical protein